MFRELDIIPAEMIILAFKQAEENASLRQKETKLSIIVQFFKKLTQLGETK